MKRTLLFIISLLSCGISMAQIGSTSTITGTDGIVYHIVLAADTNWWIQQSLGASGIPASLTDTSVHNSYYQWGRWNDGHQFKNSPLGAASPTPDNPAGLPDTGVVKFYDNYWWANGTAADQWTAGSPAEADSVTGCDPCKQILDSSWHLPGYDDWHIVTRNENIYSGATGYSSNLKLSYGGKRNGDSGYGGAMNGETMDGYFWQSTVCPNDNYPYSGREVHIRNSTADIGSCLHRTQGLQVRCVKSQRRTTTGVIDGAMKENICQIYPNPASGFITINTSEAIEHVQIVDVEGAIVADLTPAAGVHAQDIPLQNLSAGLYLVHIQTVKGLVTKRISKL